MQNVEISPSPIAHSPQPQVLSLGTTQALGFCRIWTRGGVVGGVGVSPWSYGAAAQRLAGDGKRWEAVEKLGLGGDIEHYIRGPKRRLFVGPGRQAMRRPVGCYGGIVLSGRRADPRAKIPARARPDFFSGLEFMARARPLL